MRLRAPAVLAMIGILIALVAATAAVVVTRSSSISSPPWRATSIDCRRDSIVHVHDPSRLELLARCSTFSGQVTAVKFVPAFDDLKISIRPDKQLRKYLPADNHGVLVADVIATDQYSVRAPAVTSRITAWGAWVRDKATKRVMLLPAYRISIDDRAAQTAVIRGHSVEKHGPAINRMLLLSAATPRRVVVGGRIDVVIRARWQRPGRVEPAPQIRLFVEMTAANGVGVRWKAAMTDTRGYATLHLISIQVPGDCTLSVYATPSLQNVAAQSPIHIAKA
jgi:hypothetical protein